MLFAVDIRKTYIRFEHINFPHLDFYDIFDVYADGTVGMLTQCHVVRIHQLCTHQAFFRPTAYTFSPGSRVVPIMNDRDKYAFSTCDL